MKNPTLLAAAAAVVACLVAAQPSDAQTATTEKRFPQLTLEELKGPPRALADEILKVSSVGLGGPYNLMLRSPVMGDRLFDLLAYLRFETSLPRRLNEFAILIQARLWTSQVVWHAHYPVAIKAGLSEAVAAELRSGRRPSAMQPDESVVYDVCMELSTKHAVSDVTFQRARQTFTDQQIVDLLTVSGTYVTVSMLLNAGEEPAPGGQTPLAPIP